MDQNEIDAVHETKHHQRGDGHLIKVDDPAKLAIGSVLRIMNRDGSVAPFSDCVVRAVLPLCKEVRLLRPHFAWWRSDRPVDYESFSVAFESIADPGRFRLVTHASGKPYILPIG